MGVREERRWLIEAIEQRLLPRFLERGFVSLPLSIEDRKSAEARRFNPFGRLRRRTGTRTDIADIQLTEYPPPRLCVNFAIAPEDGVVWPHVHIPQEALWASETKDWYALYRYPRFNWDFGVRRWWWQVPLEREQLFALADEVAGYLPEIDAALATGKCGPHVRRFKLA